MRLPLGCLYLDSRLRAVGAVILLLVALVAANDFLLQPPPGLDQDGLSLAHHRRGAPLLAALDDDEHGRHACTPDDGPAPLAAAPPDLACAPRRSWRLRSPASSPAPRRQAPIRLARGPPRPALQV